MRLRDESLRKRLISDFERFVYEPLPKPIWAFVLDNYSVDLRSRYSDFPIPLLIGKASGQLSMEPHQVRTDAQASLGFCVLKTVIAEDAQGISSMKAWAIPVTRMKVERIVGQDGTYGWTVTWVGRGWHKSFASYLRFFDTAISIGAEHGMLVVSSIKAHLPASKDEMWRTEEYDFTIGELLKVWRAHFPQKPMPLEFDFSPTLAGSERASQQETIINWLATVPKLVKNAAEKATGLNSSQVIRIGIKVFNSLFDDDFQLEMLLKLLSEAAEGAGPDFIVYANRLFDPNREYEGVKGVAYGGPDLSARNLKVLGKLAKLRRQGKLPSWLPISGTGNVSSGGIAFRYILCGCTTLQIHTFFQLPLSCYRKRTGNKIERSLHQLLFEPEDGLLVWLLAAKEYLGVEQLTIDALTHNNWHDDSDWQFAIAPQSG
ncbi:MAG: hypothetical protein ACUVRR_07060 [Candidatus Fervidibacter sp.]